MIEYATLEFAWLAAACAIFLWIAQDTPMLLLDGIRHARWSIKWMAASLLLALLFQMFYTLVMVLKLVVESCMWLHGMAGFLAVFGPILPTLIMVPLAMKAYPVHHLLLPMVGVYVTSIAAANLSQMIFKWGEMPVAIVAALVGPAVFSLAVGSLVRLGAVAVFGILGTIGGILAGMWIAGLTHLQIIGQGWFGILCGSSIAMGFGVAFGGLFGQTLIATLARATRLRPELAMSTGIGLFVGVILGMVMGGFIAR
jgi:hypothetical protein